MFPTLHNSGQDYVFNYFLSHAELLVCGRLTIETSFSFLLLCTVAAPEHNKHKALLMYLAMSANMEKKKYLYIIIHDKTLTGSIYKQEVYLINELLHAELVQDTEAIIPAHSS